MFATEKYIRHYYQLTRKKYADKIENQFNEDI